LGQGHSFDSMRPASARSDAQPALDRPLALA